MIDRVRTTQRNVKNWSCGEMGLRWTAAGMLKAEKQFRKVVGYTQLPQRAIAIERRLHLHQPNTATSQESLCNHHTRIAVTEVPRRTGQPPLDSSATVNNIVIVALQTTSEGLS